MKVEKIITVTFDKEDKELLKQMLNAFDKLLKKYEDLPISDQHELEEKMLNEYDLNVFYALSDDFDYLHSLIMENLDEDANADE